jgi:hypothetical protein
MMAVRNAVLASLFLASFALAFLFVPQWLIIDLAIGSRTARIWLAVGWAFAALCAFGYAAVRISSPGRVAAEDSD